MSEQDSKFAWGAEAIADVLNLPTRSVYMMHNAGRLPTRKVGGKLVGKVDDLRDFSKWPSQEGK